MSTAEGQGPRLLVVGSGTHFISGVSHHTRYLAEALTQRARVSVILMRRLIPRFLYPGRARVGDAISSASYPPSMPVFDGVDWYWVPTIAGALRFLRRSAPEALVMQWWTGAVLHTYLLLALCARARGTKVLIELHELQDTGEAALAPARAYVSRLGRLLMQMADGYLVHSDFDRDALARTFPIGGRPVRVITMGPYSHYEVTAAEPLREAPPEACNFLFFGTIRPYKGLEDLVQAFELLLTDNPDAWLTVVGETWEGWEQPIRLIENSQHRDRITLVNTYVSDEEASRWFAGADAVALPYHRSSASGPLHMTMHAGLPVVTTDVGGLREASEGYDGTILVKEKDPQSLCEGLRQAAKMRGQTYKGARGWSQAAEGVLDLYNEVA